VRDIEGQQFADAINDKLGAKMQLTGNTAALQVCTGGGRELYLLVAGWWQRWGVVRSEVVEHSCSRAVLWDAWQRLWVPVCGNVRVACVIAMCRAEHCSAGTHRCAHVGFV
jgi:hypothetical protein